MQNQSLPSIEPPKKTIPILKPILPPLKPKKKQIEANPVPKQKIEEEKAKKLTESKIKPEQNKQKNKRLKVEGESYKVGDFAYFTEKKCIGRIDEIFFSDHEAQPPMLEVTW